MYSKSDSHPWPVSGHCKCGWTELAWNISFTSVRSCLAALLSFVHASKNMDKEVLVAHCSLDLSSSECQPTWPIALTQQAVSLLSDTAFKPL